MTIYLLSDLFFLLSFAVFLLSLDVLFIYYFFVK